MVGTDVTWRPPQSALYKTKKELKMEYDNVRSREFSTNMQRSETRMPPEKEAGHRRNSRYPHTCRSGATWPCRLGFIYISLLVCAHAENSYMSGAEDDVAAKEDPLCFVVHYVKPASTDPAQWKRKEFVFLCQTEEECTRYAMRGALVRIVSLAT
jgi:hypothetical protein